MLDHTVLDLILSVSNASMKFIVDWFFRRDIQNLHGTLFDNLGQLALAFGSINLDDAALEVSCLHWNTDPSSLIDYG